MNIYYLGPEGSFSEIAVKKVYGDKNTLIPLQKFSDIVEKVKEDSNSIGALVIENSISSSVHQNVDLMFQNDIYIIGEAFMQMQMDLIGMSSSSVTDITDVYSHTQALSQCSTFLKEHNLESHETDSTSEAAQFVAISSDNTKAAIGSSLLATKTGLSIISENIANEKHNLSRWIFISNADKSNSHEVDKVTYIFKVKHEPGSLVKVLSEIAKANGNLTKIESRPLPGTNWEYGFWIDVEVPVGTKEQFDEIMKRECFDCRIVGGYKRGKLL